MIIGDKKMKTKIMVGGLLAVIMLVTVPILTASVNENNSTTTPNEINMEETPRDEAPTRKTIKVDVTEKDPVPKEVTSKKTEYYTFGYIQATLTSVDEMDFNCNRGAFFTRDITINSKDDSLTTHLKINGNTIVQRNTPVELKIDTMTNLGFRVCHPTIVGGYVAYKIVISGFASGIIVTY
jgi:hypothetical protein